VPLSLAPMGTLTVFIDRSWDFSGPIWGRSCSAFREAVWDCDEFVLRSVWANGTYTRGADVAQVNVRVMFQGAGDLLVYVDYLARGDLPPHVEGRAPVIMTGRVEIDEKHERHRWLNRTQVVGRGMLDMALRTQTYEMYALR
jgi:hypothetical protein